ncbi:MAG: sigma-54-dependent Fis family transcriptional regulator [Deltaproteobacteria bacterium]|nr:sigma-54-dependent Fis family transcriptional regulator [Deltaproteobacteria bacterium]MBW2447141.1 sigma-54-dependent Fis family transcriptional regulator [Deltaproteobacteria bacterium]
MDAGQEPRTIKTEGTEGAEALGRPLGRRRTDRIVGASRAIQQLVERATAAARSDLPVVITGPSGAGKKFLARAVHAWSNRASGPYRVIACGSLEPGTQAQEILGSRDGDGALSQLAGGTLVLADPEELPASVRKSLVEAVRERTFRREGSDESIPLEARIVATGRDSAERILGELPHQEINVPSLDARREDILPLAAQFLASSAEEAGVRPVGFTSDAREYLMAEPWTDNVRELEERVRQAVRVAGNGAISAEALMLASEAAEVPSFKEAKRAFETRYVEGLLRRCSGNISRAARLAKKDRKDFYDVIRRTGVDPQQFRG